MEKPIALGLPKQPQGGKKKGGSHKLTISAFLVVIGDSVKLDYSVEEE